MSFTEFYVVRDRLGCNCSEHHAPFGGVQRCRCSAPARRPGTLRRPRCRTEFTEIQSRAVQTGRVRALQVTAQDSGENPRPRRRLLPAGTCDERREADAGTEIPLRAHVERPGKNPVRCPHVQCLHSHSPEEHTVLLECDSTVKEAFLRHLKVYKLRRSISIAPCPDLSLWALLPLVTQMKDLKPEVTDLQQVVVLEEDPRTTFMGWRLIVGGDVKPTDIVASSLERDIEEYHRHRYALGLPEGVNDLPPGVALPLESNLVYMQGISFSKGCYLGQELTARTHHTGVVRKRLMPVCLSAPAEGLEEGLELHTQSGKLAGKHRSGVGDVGLGLIRLAHAKESLVLKTSEVGAVTVQVSVPNWWPKESKDK
ncbi:iron-sulfur cluster assembly factor IBA57, mitochondrial isoform X1 [Denticeps clupeoides]|uniref:iron-sulfur cluster assembly factor IBA57, mitochondrial isoform X1 n=1 Tax=Denticeps clupeoides TaxID=299321 RepID=UPI0010A4157C|nr:putative transferase CAF17, mitochondrial isoform X1 [Denticeps clupeoides]